MKSVRLSGRVISVLIALTLMLCIIPSSALGKDDDIAQNFSSDSVNCRVFKMPKDAVRQKFSDSSVIKAHAENLSAASGKFHYNGYSHLNDVQKHIYDEMVVAAKNLNTDPFLVIENTKDIGSIGDIELVFMVVMADHPEIFWLSGYLSIGYDEYTDGSYDFYMVITYIISDKNELDEKVSELNAVVKTLTDSVKGKTDYDKELYFHDYLCETITYKIDDLGYCFTVYGALVNGESVCEGYAESMQLLLNACDINCVTIRGIANGDGHMWNIVELPTGWHTLDVTWDDYHGTTRYNYFNINNSIMEKDHTPSTMYNENNIPDDFGEHLEFNFCLPEAEHEDGNGGTLSGQLICAGGGNTAGMKLSLYLNSTNELFSEFTIEKNSSTYSHQRFPAGDYTLKVTKDTYTTRTYDLSFKNSNKFVTIQLNHIGDINADGFSDKKDFRSLKAHISETEKLTDYNFAIMDVNGDGSVDKRDMNLYKKHISGTKLLW